MGTNRDQAQPKIVLEQVFAKWIFFQNGKHVVIFQIFSCQNLSFWEKHLNH